MSDPYWSNVVLLAYNDNAADGSTTFVDQSLSAHALTAVGNAQYDTAQAPTGLTSSLLLDGTGDKITTPDSADWHFGSGNWTVEQWVRFNSLTGAHVFANHGYQFTNTRSWVIYYMADSLHLAQSYDGSNNLDVSRAWVALANTWYHVAVAREGTNVRMFIDGTQIGTNITAFDLFNSDQLLTLGADTSGHDVNGWMAAQRITKGIARYTGTFTPPTLPLANTTTLISVLMNQYRQRRN